MGYVGKFVVNHHFYLWNCGDAKAVMYPSETISIRCEAYFNRHGAIDFADEKQQSNRIVSYQKTASKNSQNFKARKQPLVIYN